MALTVGELAVELDATDGQFRRSLKEDERQVNRFASASQKGTKSAADSFKRLGGSITKVAGIIGALGGVLGAIAFGSFLREGVKAAANFEQIGIALEVLTGNAEGARKVLADVNQLVVRTPFGLDQVASSARSLAVVFGDNTDAVSEFTGIAADLAAAFGRPVEQIGENLSRAFTAGIGAADIFREAGITAEIQRITGATDLASISGVQLADALRQITDEGGKAFGAAEAQANSLGGALSNTSIAFDNLRRTFAEAFSDELIAVLVDTVQPAFQRLEQLVKDNSDEIGDFAGKVIPALIRAFAGFVETAADVIRALGKLQSGFVFIQGVVAQGIESSLRDDLESLEEQLVTARAAEERFGKDRARQNRAELGQLNADQIVAEIGRVRGELREAEQTTAQFADAFNEGSPLLNQFAEAADRVASEIEKAAEAARAGREAAEEPDESSGGTGKPRQALGDIAGLNRLTGAEARAAKTLRDAIAKTQEEQLTATERELSVLDREIAAVKALGINKADEGVRTQRLLQLEQKRLDIINSLARAEESLPAFIGAVQDEINGLSGIDPARAAELTAQLQQIIVGGVGDPRTQVEAVSGLLEQLRVQTPDTVSAGVSEGLARTSFDGFFAAFSGESFNFAQSFAGVLHDAVQPELTRAFEESVQDLGSLIDGALKGVGLDLGFGGEGGLFGAGGFLDDAFGQGAGKLFGQGALGILSTGLSSALREDAITSSVGNIQSAVTSAERVRGIVAGPTSIAVAQVDRAISDSFVETNRILGLIERNTRSSGSPGAASLGSVAPTTSDPATSILANESPSFA